jgi:hypothetical protein
MMRTKPVGEAEGYNLKQGEFAMMIGDRLRALREAKQL